MLPDPSFYRRSPVLLLLYDRKRISFAARHFGKLSKQMHQEQNHRLVFNPVYSRFRNAIRHRWYGPFNKTPGGGSSERSNSSSSWYVHGGTVTRVVRLNVIIVYEYTHVSNRRGSGTKTPFNSVVRALQSIGTLYRYKIIVR